MMERDWLEKEDTGIKKTSMPPKRKFYTQLISMKRAANFCSTYT
jgi:hypothetical protein